NLDFADVKVPNHAFKRVVRDMEFDVAELAISTYLTAKAHDKPLVLLPVVVRGKFQHESIVCSAARPLAPSDLPGRRVGIRSHSVTTVTWVRGILQNDYGVDLDSVKWVTFEDAHVAEVRDPETFERAPAGKDPLTMLLAGELDAAVMTGASLKDPRVRSLIANPAAAAQSWYQRYQAVPVNHMVTIRESLLKSSPWVAEEIFRLLAESKKAAGLPAGTGPDPFPLGVEANRKSLELVIKYAAQQRLIPRRYEVGELFDDVTRALGR
ncbi:MAG: phosphate ABC transporter substrate-binding protein, partial [Burkholderiales bacterium]|nr:phosphate ABC transporter substrate-binding protein [Burkholderiales bacterium]